ncbi:MAG TPA: protein phosphatase CheZ [Pseudorhodoplanes sp.]|jgi:chemotaxis protein CheZ|nr:protein phosphatase CheZ [Pseudorhodoplanes sp.]
MAVQRKVFRIEEMLQGGLDGAAPAAESAQGYADVVRELQALRELVAAQAAPHPARQAQTTQIGEARKLKIELDVIGEAIRQTRSEITTLQDQGFDNARVARVTHELDAVVKGAENATDTILKAAEAIDEMAGTLCAALANTHERALAEDIQDRVTKIFEACNFHDLTGQRITKVAATMKLVEDHIARMTEIWSVVERFGADEPRLPTEQSLLNGPKLDGEAGHSTQDDIDALFG